MHGMFLFSYLYSQIKGPERAADLKINKSAPLSLNHIISSTEPIYATQSFI